MDAKTDIKMKRTALLIVSALIPLLMSAGGPVRYSARKVSMITNPEGMAFGFWANNKLSDNVFDDFGRRPYERYGFFSWKAVETSPGVYETKNIVNGIRHSHSLGSNCVISLNNISGPWFNKAKGSQIPSFYPQDITNPETRKAGLKYIHSVIRTLLQETGDLIVCFDYEMMWHCRPDNPVKQKMLSEWFVEAAAEARAAADEIGMADALHIICIVNGATEDETLIKLLGSPFNGHKPAEWLVNIVNCCDYLAIDSYDFDKADPENPAQTMKTIGFWIQNYSQGKPVLVTEFGYSTAVSYFPDYKTQYHATGTEEQQAGFYRALIPALEKENVPGGKLNGQVRCFCFWMYSDIVTKKAASERENHFGLIRLDGSHKPGFDEVHSGINRLEAAGSRLAPSVESSREKVTFNGGGVTTEFVNGTRYNVIEVVPSKNRSGKITLGVSMANEGPVIVECGGRWLRSLEPKTTHKIQVDYAEGDVIRIIPTGYSFPFTQQVKSVKIY